MAGGYLAIGSCLSAVTRNQVIAFVVSVAVCFLFTVSGLPIVTDFFSSWAPQQVVSTIASFSFLTHFNAITRGVIDLRDVIYFASLIATWLVACGIVVDMKKAG
jgi:ABC-2 type transport system permease protein